jgi:replication-associated recombination protein RarA
MSSSGKTTSSEWDACCAVRFKLTSFLRSSFLAHRVPGKTTLARIIANTTRAHFIAINAVLSGVKEIREAISTAQKRQKEHNQRTILFVDEVHRFNKSQQDAMLPWVENGTVILIGATTENPYFEVNKALVSRSRIFQLKLLDEADLRGVLEQALADSERGYGQLSVIVEPDAIAHLVNVANGDARSLLNALELAVETTPPDETGTITLRWLSRRNRFSRGQCSMTKKETPTSIPLVPLSKVCEVPTRCSFILASQNGLCRGRPSLHFPAHVNFSE